MHYFELNQCVLGIYGTSVNIYIFLIFLQLWVTLWLWYNQSTYQTMHSLAIIQGWYHTSQTPERGPGWAGDGASLVGNHAPDSQGTSRWPQGRRSMAIQSAAIIHGRPTSCHHQVVSVSGLLLPRTNVPCLHELVCEGLETHATPLRPQPSLHCIVCGSQAKLANLEMDSQHRGSWWHIIIPHLRSSYVCLEDRD